MTCHFVMVTLGLKNTTPTIFLRHAVSELADTLTRTYRDRVWVVQLKFGALVPASPLTPPPPPREHSLGSAGDPTAAANLGAFLKDFNKVWGPSFDIVIIDPSDLFAANVDVYELLLAAAVTASLPGGYSPAAVRINYLIDEPEQHRTDPVINVQNVALLKQRDYSAGSAWMNYVDNPDKLSTLPGALGDLWWGLVKFYGSGGGSATGTANVWPIDAVRVLLPKLYFTNVVQGNDVEALKPAARPAFERWARAVSGRRVGLAIGGAAALSYAGAAMVKRLRDRQIPIDVISGTSFGSVVSCFYAVRGDAGLQLLEKHWYWTQLTVLFAWVTNNPLQLWINFDLGFADINDLDLTFIPVATQANTGYEVPLRSGFVGHVCGASGSLPPLAPTYDNNVRLIDGALSCGVPASFVRAAADIVIACNVIPYPVPLSLDPNLPLPRLWNVLRTLSPTRRVIDMSRMFGMLFRAGGHSQDRDADVIYRAQNKYADGLAFYSVQTMLAQLQEDSKPLDDATAETQARWNAVNHPAGPRVRFWRVNQEILLGDNRGPFGELGAPASLDSSTLSYLHAVGELMGRPEYEWLTVTIAGKADQSQVDAIIAEIGNQYIGPPIRLTSNTVIGALDVRLVVAP